MFDYSIISWALCLSSAGALGGFLLGNWLFHESRFKPRDFQGPYFGGLPIAGAVGMVQFCPGLPAQNETIILALVVCGFALLGMIRDFRKVSLNVILPYQLLLIILGAYFGIVVFHPVRWMEIALSLTWPIIILYCLKLASLVFEMPFLLCLGSGITFLLFFPSQQSTPPWVVVLTLCLMTISAFCLGYLLMREKRSFLGDSGLFALGYLLSGISMLGRSKSLLMFGLLVPSMVIFYPFVLICALLMSSYVGNELYHPDPKSRRSLYKWSLSRERLVVFSSVMFLCLNFLALFIRIDTPWYGYLSLFILFMAAVASFINTFARKAPTPIVDTNARVQILGVPMDVITTEAVLQKVDDFLSRGEGLSSTDGARARNRPDGEAFSGLPSKEGDMPPNRADGDVFGGLFHIVTADSLAVMRAYKDKSFGRIINRASLILPDGAGLLWAADFLGTPLPARIAGVSLVSDLCKQAGIKGSTIYLLGSKPGIAVQTGEMLEKQFPGLKVVGTHHGFFLDGSEIEDALINNIQQKKPDILFVGLGVPKQEFFIHRLRPMVSRMVAVGVGGSFDVISGTLPRAPLVMQRFALEWLFRLLKEPCRVNRIMKIPWFVLAVIRAKWQDEEFVV